MPQEKCPHFQEINYRDKPERSTQAYQVVSRAFPKSKCPRFSKTTNS